MATATGEDSGHPAVWYVVFHDGPDPYWWWPLCKPGFRHVLAFGYSVNADAWLIQDVTVARTIARAVTPETFDAWLATLPPERTILRYESPVVIPDARQWGGFRLGFWCTPAIAHLIGSPSRALRPHALFRDLVRLGARPAFTASPETDRA